MNQNITGFHKDFEDHWVAELACGHGQHVRHDPPWQERLWVTTDEGRRQRLGQKLNCVRCDDMGMKIAKSVLEACRNSMRAQYESAGLHGLCVEGRWDLAIDSLNTLDLTAIVAAGLSEHFDQ